MRERGSKNRVMVQQLTTEAAAKRGVVAAHELGPGVCNAENMEP